MRRTFGTKAAFLVAALSLGVPGERVVAQGGYPRTFADAKGHKLTLNANLKRF